MSLDHVTGETFEQEVMQSGVPVLVDFYADWCPPCKALAPVLEELAGEYKGRANIVKVNTENDPALAGDFQVRSIPALFLIKSGEVVWQAAGARPAGELRAILDEHVSEPEAAEQG